MGALLYFGGKFLAYSAWCYFGLRALRPQNSRTLGRAIVFGMIRLSLGFFFGILIYFLSSALVTSLAPGLPENVIAYLAVYVPVRWIEWTIMAILILPGPLSPSQWIAGSGRTGDWAELLSPAWLTFRSSLPWEVSFPSAGSCAEAISSFLAPIRSCR